MRVAVTGATGVIGSAAVAELVRAGHDVVGLARTPEKAQQLVDAGATAVRTSLLDHLGMVAMLAWSAVRHTITLYKAEPLPPR